MSSLDVEGITAFLAGAGTGKTYTTCEKISEAVTGGVDPERIIATTFTNKAAAELQDRVQQHIYEENDELPFEQRVEFARDVERAAIGTMHSLGKQFLNRYALQLGLSPRLKILDEEVTSRKLDEFFAELESERLDRLNEAARPFELEKPEEVVQELLEQKRINHISDEDFRRQMHDSLRRLRELLAPEGPDESRPGRDEFIPLAAQVRDELQAIKDPTNKTEKIIRYLNQALRGEQLTWKNLAKLVDREAGKRSGANELLSPVRDFVRSLRRWPGLHEDLQKLVEVLTEETIRTERDYQSFKQQRGLLDYIDLEVHFLEALDQPTVAEDFRESYDMLLVDEFQDSSPIQLAIFFRLHELIENSFWVGDEKQSIYGFRDADLELVREAVGLLEEDQRESLPKSYRAHRGLVEVFNDLFTPVFGEQARLEADEDKVPDKTLERWCLDVDNNAEEFKAIAGGVQELIDEGTPADEIAVLTRTNHSKTEVAGRLDERGIPTQVEQPGLLSRRECALAFAGAKLVADSEDHLAHAEIHHLLESAENDPPNWLIDRLQMVREADRNPRTEWEDEIYEKLDQIQDDILSPKAVVSSIIQALDLPRQLLRWGRPARRFANLDALLELADEYEEQMIEQGRGVTLRGFIEWMEEREGDGEDTIPARQGFDAVTVTTYHQAKGLEWPVVVLADLDKTYEPNMWEPRISGGRTAAGRPLADRSIHYWPWPFGHYQPPNSPKKKYKTTGLFDDALDSEEGRYEQRKEDDEHERLMYVGITRASREVVLTHRGKVDNLPQPSNYRWLAKFPIDEVLEVPNREGIHYLEEYDTNLRLRVLSPEDPGQEHPSEESGRGLELPADDIVEYAPRYRLPSDQSGPSGPAQVSAEALPGEHPFKDRIAPGDWSRLGNALHAYFAAESSLAPERRGELARRCLQNYGVDGVIEVENIITAGDRLTRWIDDRYPNSTQAREVPLSASLGESQGVGEVDLLIETGSDDLVVVDHKIKPVPEQLWEETAQKYTGQLADYRSILQELGYTVESSWIHLPLGGGIAQISLSRNLKMA